MNEALAVLAAAEVPYVCEKRRPVSIRELGFLLSNLRRQKESARERERKRAPGFAVRVEAPAQLDTASIAQPAELLREAA